MNVCIWQKYTHPVGLAQMPVLGKDDVQLCVVRIKSLHKTLLKNQLAHLLRLYPINRRLPKSSRFREVCEQWGVLGFAILK